MIEVPSGLLAYQVKYRGEAGREWVAGLPALAARYLEQWNLRLDGRARHGHVALVLPVLTADGTPAVLKLQQVDEEHYGEGIALRVWDGRGAVRLLDEEPTALLLERLDADRPLSTVADDMRAVKIIAELLARLTAYPAPAGVALLSDVVAAMLDRVDPLAKRLSDVDQQRLLRKWGAIVREVATDGTGDRLLHWDLHYENVLAGGREPWLAIDPKPLAGDPGFDLCPVLWNRWGESPVLRRFDLMVEVLGLPGDRAAAWTVARVLQNALWDIADGYPTLNPEQAQIARAMEERLT